MNKNIKLRDVYENKFITSFNELMTTDRYPDGVLDSSIIKVADNNYVYIEPSILCDRLGIKYDENDYNRTLCLEISKLYFEKLETQKRIHPKDAITKAKLMFEFAVDLMIPTSILRWNMKQYILTEHLDPNHLEYSVDVNKFMQLILNTTHLKLNEIFNAVHEHLLEENVIDLGHNVIKHDGYKIKDPVLLMQIQQARKE